MSLRELEFLIDPFENVEFNLYAWRNDEPYYFKTVCKPWYKSNMMNCRIINIRSGFDIDSSQSFLIIDVFAHDSIED